MKKSFLSLIFFICFFFKGSSSQSSNHTLLHLTNETFNSALVSNPYVFLIFHKENRASQLFLQMFTKFVEEQNKNNSFLPQIQFAAIDLVSSIPLRNTQNITGFPLMRLYNQKTNKTVEYDGGRSEDSLKKWLTRQFKETPALIKEIKTIGELDTIIEKKSIIMAYFGPRYFENYEIFFNTAEKYPYYNFIFGFSIDIFEKYLGDDYPNGRIMCFNSE